MHFSCFTRKFGFDIIKYRSKTIVYASAAAINFIHKQSVQKRGSEYEYKWN